MDQTTIEAARRGDRCAQAALLRALQDRWYRLCLGLLGNAEEARDATQETALRFLKHLPGFRGQSSLETWSMGIAINIAREMRRKASRLWVVAPRDMESPQEAAETKESRSLLWSLLHELPQRQREALLLRYFEDLSIQDTAEAMNCAAGTVKATVHQALRTLRTRLKAIR